MFKTLKLNNTYLDALKFLIDNKIDVAPIMSKEGLVGMVDDKELAYQFNKFSSTKEFEETTIPSIRYVMNDSNYIYLDNAATTIGLKAMDQLQKTNKKKAGF